MNSLDEAKVVIGLSGLWLKFEKMIPRNLIRDRRCCDDLFITVLKKNYIRNENETQRALDDLMNPETNSDIQLFIESKKKKRLRQAANATIERLTASRFLSDSVCA
nr:hypothetical protein [Tanacetum cinerariifolium]